jgi:phosphoribosylanthranilate isomerase
MSHLRVKICGITNVADARAAAEGGTDAIGLNFHPPSPRCVRPADAIEIIRELPMFVEPVGVFTDARPMNMLWTDLGLKYIQWHGETAKLPPFSPAARDTFRLIVAFRVRDRQTLREVESWIKESPTKDLRPHAILLDGFHKDLLGGTGQTAPWELLADWDPGLPLILAGGLTPENVAEAVRIVRPYAVDVASGVESSPGKKDVDKIKRFIENARSV